MEPCPLCHGMGWRRPVVPRCDCGHRVFAWETVSGVDVLRCEGCGREVPDEPGMRGAA